MKQQKFMKKLKELTTAIEYILEAVIVDVLLILILLIRQERRPTIHKVAKINFNEHDF